MTFWNVIVSLARGLLVAICFSSIAEASNYGPTPATQDLQAIIAAEPAIRKALIESFEKQNSMRILLSNSFMIIDDCTLEIEFAYHLGDEAVLKAKRDTSSTAC